jgi:electron transfer flavoprotein beta subunit
MRIVVCLKQVFDPQSVRVSSRGELDARDAVRVANAADLCALETALRVKYAQGAHVIAMTLGDATAEGVLRQALAMGADGAVLLCDQLFTGGDAGAVAYALAQAVRHIGAVDVVLTGACSWDDNSGQVGPHIAELLGWAQITFAYTVELAGGAVSANRRGEDGSERASVPLPAVVTVVPATILPRLGHAARIMTPNERGVDVWDAAAIAADPALLGARGSLTTVLRRFAPEAHTKGDVLDGAPRDAARTLAAHLRQRGLI